jgi:glycosyl transferase family 2
MSDGARLAVVMVAGECRDRVQRALDALCRQTAIDALEIAVVDVAGDRARELTAPCGAPVRIIRRPGEESWAEARRAGLEGTAAPLVAFVEEHCFVEPDWAEALLAAHEGPWASVGYGFRNANPETYVSRSGMLTDYGLWLEPVRRGPTSLLASNNVSYKRDTFLSLADRLDDALESDFVAQEAFRQRGLPMFVESRAVTNHLNFTTFRETGSANYAWCRAMAARRARAGGWSRSRRIAQATVTPVSAPLFRIGRLVRTLRDRRPLWGQFAAGLPIVLGVGIWAGVGEAVGYVLGAGAAERHLKRWELDVERVSR